MLYKLTTTNNDLGLEDQLKFDSDAPWGSYEETRVFAMIEKAVSHGWMASLWIDRPQEPDENPSDYIVNTMHESWDFDDTIEEALTECDVDEDGCLNAADEDLITEQVKFERARAVLDYIVKNLEVNVVAVQVEDPNG